MKTHRFLPASELPAFGAWLLALCYGCILLFAPFAHSQNAPPKTLIVGFPPGGSTDILARKLARQIENDGRGYVLISNQTGEAGLTAARAFQNAVPNGIQYMLVRASSANATDPVASGGVHPMVAGGGLQGLISVASIGTTQLSNGYTWYGIFAPPGTNANDILSFQVAVVFALGAPELRQTLSDLKIVNSNGSHVSLSQWVAESQASAQNIAPASVSTQTNARNVASSSTDDAKQAGKADAPPKLSPTANFAETPKSSQTAGNATRESPPVLGSKTASGLTLTNLNIFNDLPVNMSGVRVAQITDRAEEAQQAVNKDRGSDSKRHVAAAEASQCLKLNKDARLYDGFINSCNYAVEFNFCLYHPEKDSWGAWFDCEKGDGSGGSWQVGPLKNVGAHTHGPERVHWFACRWGETLGKPDGVSPADVHFDRDSRRMMGRCATWGRASERYATAPNAASASQTVQPSAQRPAGAAQQSSTPTASTQIGIQARDSNVTSAQQFSGGTGKWPAGVEPGNLYIVRHRLTTDAFSSEELMLISARSKAEAEQQYERAYNVYRGEALKPFYDQGGTAGRANLAFHEPRYKMDYQVTQECLGANWGAVVVVNENRQLGNGAACGARTPAEAITAAFEVCSRKGYNCNREGSRNPTPIITIAHSGARPWVEPIDKPRVGSSWPSATFQFTSLSATTYQMHASTIDYVQGPNEAIASFGKACGKKAHARDIYSCWISTRMMPCLLSSPINPQDRMPMQQTCIDVKLTKDGYLP